MAAAKQKLWIGTAGWQYDDWYGVFFPATRPAKFQPLRYLARYFNAVEVNASFYRILTPRATAGWLAHVPDEFRFTMKLFRGFTHERETYPPPAERDACIASMTPLRDAQRLGPLLIQFPWSFRFTPGNVARIERIAADFSDFSRFIEVRHASWIRPEGLAAIRKCGGFCNIDQPALRDCIGPTAEVANRTTYVRLHGRNAANWFREDQPGYERYNYLYTETEIHEWVQRLRGIEPEVDEQYIIANNHYRGQAPANAIELRSLLEQRPVAAPAELIATYPRLAAVTTSPFPTSLFD